MRALLISVILGVVGVGAWSAMLDGGGSGPDESGFRLLFRRRRASYEKCRIEVLILCSAENIFRNFARL